MAKGIIPQPPARYLDPNHRPVSITHLWHLNEDCLIKLFAFLADDDLKNIAQTHPVFLHCASISLFIRWQKTGIDTVYVDFGTNTNDILHFPTHKHIHVTHQFLRTFGKYVKKLHCSVRDQAVVGGLLGFCPNVEDLSIEGIFNNSSRSNLFCKPLVHLKKLQFIRGELSSTAITQYQSWCPNIICLKFVMIYTMVDRNCIHFHFPHLKHFIIESASPFKTENIQMMLNKNPQIEILRIAWPQFDSQSFNVLCKSFESLETLKMRLIHGFEPIFLQKQLHRLKQVKEVEIDCWGHWSSTLLLVSKYFPNVHTLTIKLLDGNEISIPTDDIESISVMPNLERFKLQFDVPRDDQLESLLRFSSKMPKLIKLDVRSNIRNIDMLNQCFVNFTQLEALLLSGRATGSEDATKVFNSIFHRRFNRVVGDRDAATMDINIEDFRGATYNVNKQHILRNLRIICTNLSYEKKI